MKGRRYMDLMHNRAFQGYTFEDRLDEENATVMVIRNRTGEGTMRCFDTIPGVTLSYNSLRMDTCYQQVSPMEGYISLNYCREGCFQVTLDNGSVYFLGEGDIVISDPGRAVITDSRCPSGIFEGFTVTLEISLVSEWISKNASWISTSWLYTPTEDPVVIIPNVKEIWHLAEGFYGRSIENNRPLRIIKVLELLEMLSYHICDASAVEYYSMSIIQATERVYSHILKDPTARLTLGELCSRFGISKSSLSDCFRSIYGTSPVKLVREKRIRYAAKLIREYPKKNIGDIASEVGYDNASKFSSAFREVMNELPLEYRKRNMIRS